MLTTLRTKTLKGYILKPTQYRQFSGAVDIKDRFEAAWLRNQQSRVLHAKEPEDKEKYGSGYIQRNYKGMKKGYVHPYH